MAVQPDHYKILCVCMGNHDRSPLMMGIIAHTLQQRDIMATVESCGVWDGLLTGEFHQTASANSIAVLEARGIDISNHRTRHISLVNNIRGYHRYIVVTDEVKDELIKRGVDSALIRVINAEAGGLTDPHGNGVHEFIKCLDTVERCLGDVLEGIM